MKYHPIYAGVSYIPGVSTQGKSILAPNVWHAGACWLVEANKLISGIKSFGFQIPSPFSALAGGVRLPNAASAWSNHQICKYKETRVNFVWLRIEGELPIPILILSELAMYGVHGKLQNK